jgi:molybdate transport system ATP-binding protein
MVAPQAHAMSSGLSAHVRVARGRFLLEANVTAPGEGVTALFGPSGAGKSLLLSALAGLVRLQSGRIELGGRLLDDTGQGLHTPPHMRGVGLVFQDARLLPHLNVRANLAFAQKRAPKRQGSLRFDEAVSFFDIASLLDRSIHNLSGGEKSRVALARAVLSAPELLLLDEPFAALDGARRRAFLATLKDMSRAFALPMMVVTHQIDDVAALADSVVALAAGKIVAAGPLMEVAVDERFQALLDAHDSGAPVKIAGQGPAAAVWVRADNVLLARAAPNGLSARHVWRSEIEHLTHENETSTLVRVRAEQGAIFSRITPAACAELQLEQGGEVWAIVKAHSL